MSAPFWAIAVVEWLTLTGVGYLRKGGKVIKAIIAIVIIGFILGVLGLIA